MEAEPQREPQPEIPLQGGQLTPGIVHVGNTVRRPSKGNAAFVYDLLIFLEDQGFPFAPRFFGRDEQGRDTPFFLVENNDWPAHKAGPTFFSEDKERVLKLHKKTNNTKANSLLVAMTFASIWFILATKLLVQ